METLTEGTNKKMSTKPAGVRSRRPRTASASQDLADAETRDSSMCVADADASPSPMSVPPLAARLRQSRNPTPASSSSAMRPMGEVAKTTSRMAYGMHWAGRIKPDQSMEMTLESA